MRKAFIFVCHMSRVSSSQNICRRLKSSSSIQNSYNAQFNRFDSPECVELCVCVCKYEYVRYMNVFHWKIKWNIDNDSDCPVFLLFHFTLQNHEITSN